MNKQNFYHEHEEALKDHFSDNVAEGILDDDMVEAFDEWYAEQDEEDLENLNI